MNRRPYILIPTLLLVLGLAAEGARATAKNGRMAQFPTRAAVGVPALQTRSTGWIIWETKAAHLATDVADFRRPLNLLTDEQGFEMAGDLIGTAGVRMIDEGIPGNIDGVARVLGAEFRTWDDFVSYVRAVGNKAEGVDLLVELGVDEGSLLVGAVARHGDVGFELTVDQIRAVKRFGDDLFEAGVRLSDEAAAGITRTISDVGEAGFERLVNGLRHADGSLQAEQVEQALVLVGRAAFAWTEESLEGIGRSARLIGASGTQRLFGLGEDAREAFAAVAVRGCGIWDEAAAEGLARLFQKGLADDILRGSRQSDFYLEMLRAYDDDTAEGVLRLLREGDPSSASHILQRSSDPRDLFQWRSRSNLLDDLQDARAQYLRRNMTSAEYAELRQRIFDRWNNGQEMPIERLREAFGVEGPIWALQKQYPDRFEIVWVNTRPGGQGVDAVLWDLVGERWVIGEGKGTSQAVTELAGDMFPTPPTLGRQLSLPWIVEDADRYLNLITDPPTRARVQQMVLDVRDGAVYDVLIGRGGIRPTRLDYGSKLSDFLTDIDSTKLALRRFVFVTSP